MRLEEEIAQLLKYKDTKNKNEDTRPNDSYFDNESLGREKEAIY